MLPPTVRAANGYRFYNDNAVRLLLFVKRAQSLGITLKEIKPLLTLVALGERPCTKVKQIARNHLEEIDARIHALEALRKELHALLRRKVNRPYVDEVCPIIERR